MYRAAQKVIFYFKICLNQRYLRLPAAHYFRNSVTADSRQAGLQLVRRMGVKNCALLNDWGES
jgi:hypothetical protein